MIQFIQWDGRAETANRFIGEAYGVDWEYVSQAELAIFIMTPRGRMRVALGEWFSIEGRDGR